MKVALSGSHGLIGRALTRRLQADGHTVTPIPRGADGALEPGDLSGTDAVVHLAGEGIGDHRWSDSHKDRVLTSRVVGTRLISNAVAIASPRPTVLLSASAVGYYGDRGDEELTEASGAGTGFLADVCKQWEAATATAQDAGVRVLHLRTGIVLSKDGGALAKTLPIFKLAAGGKLGNGRQWVSWISIDDEVGAIAFALTAADLSGAANLTAPSPVTWAEFAKAIGRAVHRPAVVPVPAFALKVATGREMANEMLLASQRAVPAALQAAGYQFAEPGLDGALRSVLG